MASKITDVSCLQFPVLAFTPIGIMAHTKQSNLLRCMAREYRLGWYTDLEIIDSKGNCIVIHKADTSGSLFFATIFNRMLEVRVADAEALGQLTMDAIRDRVSEFMSLYPDMYEASGCYEEILSTVDRASTPAEVVIAFIPK